MYEKTNWNAFKNKNLAELKNKKQTIHSATENVLSENEVLWYLYNFFSNLFVKNATLKYIAKTKLSLIFH